MSPGMKISATPAKLWMNWPLWGGLLAMLLLAKHAWVLFAPAEQAVPATAVTAQPAQAGELFGTVSTTAAAASLNGIRPIGIFAGKHGFAVMQTESGQVGVGVGGEVAPGVKLVETHADHVILERNGMRQRVDLSDAPAASGGIVAVQNATPAQAATAPERLLNQLTPEQRSQLQQQQMDLIRGRH